MDAQVIRQHRITMTVALVIAGLALLMVPTISSALLSGSRPPTIEARSLRTSSPAVAPVPRLISRAEARFLVRRGATAPTLAAENQRRWERLQRRMLHERWIIGLQGHRPRMTMMDVYGVLARR
jgi:hypothetical protein